MLFIYFQFDCWDFQLKIFVHWFKKLIGPLLRGTKMKYLHSGISFCELLLANLCKNTRWTSEMPCEAYMVQLCTALGLKRKADNCYAQRFLASIIIFLPILLAWSLTNQNNAHFLKAPKLFFFFPTRKMYMRKIDIFSRLFCYSTSVILLNIREWKYLGGCYNTLGTQLLSIKKLLILHCSISVLFECWVHV